MDIDISQLSRTQLAELHKRPEQDIKIRSLQEKKAFQKKYAEKRRAIVKQVHELLKNNNLNLDDVINQKHSNINQPKYRNPLNSKETWTGKGRKPNWILNLLQQGKTIDELKITY